MSADELPAALVGPAPLRDVRALRPSLTGELADLADAVIRRLGLQPGSPEAELLVLISGRPGLSAAELTELFPAFERVAPALLADEMVTSKRFDLADCWTRTARGAQAVRALSA